MGVQPSGQAPGAQRLGLAQGAQPARPEPGPEPRSIFLTTSFSVFSLVTWVSAATSAAICVGLPPAPSHVLDARMCTLVTHVLFLTRLCSAC